MYVCMNFNDDFATEKLESWKAGGENGWLKSLRTMERRITLSKTIKGKEMRPLIFYSELNGRRWPASVEG